MQCEHTLKQTGGGNKETSTEEYYSISQQILRTNSVRNVWQIVRNISVKIKEVKEFIGGRYAV